MNSSYTVSAPQQNAVANNSTPEDGDTSIHLTEYLDILIDGKWLILIVTILAALAGTGYALLTSPIYYSNLLIQVEDAAPDAKGFLGDASSLFEIKTPSAGEIEVIRSRLVVGGAVDSTRYYINAKPHFAPLIGEWLSRRAKSKSTPLSLFGMRGTVYGNESIVISQFDVPEELQDRKPFTILTLENGHFELHHKTFSSPIKGVVGQALHAEIPSGSIDLKIEQLDANVGAEFIVQRASRLQAIEDLQKRLQTGEQGRQSNVIKVALEDSDRGRLKAILNAIGTKYVEQNRERKAAKAERTLDFLDAQLPDFKRQLERSEDAYTRFRNQNSTVAFDEEAKATLKQIGDLQAKLLEAQQKRRELTSLYTGNHPRIQTIDQQIALIQKDMGALNARVGRMPTIQQDTFRFERDVRVGSQLYQSLLNNALQLRLVKEGKTGNVRLLDVAVEPFDPVKPQKTRIVVLALALGFFAGAALTLAKSVLFRGIRNPQEIESHTGLSVLSVIPFTPEQQLLEKSINSGAPGLHLLTVTHPESTAVESLRSMRIALQFTLLEAENNRIMITGPTPGIGKSFVSANFASIMANSGKHVLLIDADLRKGHINKQFGFAREKGLSELLIGDIRLEDALHREAQPNLDVLTTGRYPVNPADMLMSDTFARLLDELSPRYDLVIIDTPPVLVAADATAVSALTSAVLMVARADLTQMGELVESTKRLKQGGKAPSGVIFNAMDMTRRHYGSHGYRYGGYRYTEYKYNAQ